MADEKKTAGEKIAELATAENIQRYILGTKKNGSPRALYDIVKDFSKPTKKKKKKGKHKKKHDGVPVSTYEVYLANRKKKKKKKKSKHWHI